MYIPVVFTCNKSSAIVVPSSSQNRSFVSVNTLLNAPYFRGEVELPCEEAEQAYINILCVIWMLAVNNSGILTSALYSSYYVAAVYIDYMFP